VIAGGAVAPGHGAPVLRCPWLCPEARPRGPCVKGRVRRTCRRQPAVRPVGPFTRGGRAVACAAGSPAYGAPVAAPTRACAWSGLRCWVHGRAASFALGRFVFFRRCLKVAPPMSRNGYIFLTFATRTRVCAASGCRCGRLLGGKHETPACCAGVRGLRPSKCPPPLTGHPHRCPR
jgi:hypothetical protein